MSDVTDRAMRAQEKARKLLYTSWTPFVRMLSRNPKMQVILSGKLSATDGKNRVYLKVPIELGDDTPHDKGVCGTRDPSTFVMVCPACAIADETSYKIFHESSHIVEGTFEAMTEADLQAVVAEGIRISAEGKADGSRAKKIQAKFEKDKKFIDSYFVASNYISPFMRPLFNAIEDVYVNSKTLALRPGLAATYMAHQRSVFENGHTELDGEHWTWSEAPLNAQATVSVIPAGTADLEHWEDWFAPEVIEAHKDPEIQEMVGSIAQYNTSRKRYFLTMRLLEAFRRYGFFVLPDDEEDDPQPDEGKGSDSDKSDSGEGAESKNESSSSPKGDDGEKEDGEPDDGDGGSGDGTDDDEEDTDTDGGGGSGDDEEEGDEPEDSDGDGSDDPDEDDSDDDGEGSESEPKDYGDAETVKRLYDEVSGHADGDDKTDPEQAQAEKEMEVAIQQGEHFTTPSRTISGLQVIQPGGGYAFRRGNGTLEPPSPTVIGQALLKGRLAFTENLKGRTERNLTRGKRLDGRMLAKRMPHEDYRVFKTKSLPGKRSYFVCVGLDVSGSTGGHICQLIKNCGAAQAELLHRLGVTSAVYAHTGDEGVLIHEVQAPGASWGDPQKKALASIGSYSANLDGHTLEYYRKVCDSRPETVKVILYFTDGAMPAENYREELEILKREIHTCRQKGYILLGVGVQNNDPEEHGLETVRLDSAEDIGQVLDRLRTKLN